jgi:DedD protein
MNEADPQLPLKKRARRRLVGAIALAALAAVVLPMVMDQSPQAPVADVQIRIPGQEQAPAFNPKTKSAEAPKASVPVVAQAASPASSKPEAIPVAPPVKAEPATKPTEKTTEKAADKPVEKPAAKPTEKPADKPTAKTAEDDSRRAAALLAGKAPDAAANGQFVILIGAFANPANVKQLQTKLGEIGVKTFTEPLESPQGNKTRVRAGPFPNRDAADKALDRMKRIGVNGIVTAKQ